jgi:hypothetical protein
MDSTPPSLDIVAVFIAIATVIFGRDMASIIGPYAVIFLGAMLGGMWSATRRESKGPMSTAIYLFGIVLMSLLFTVPVAEFVARHTDSKDARQFFAPAALLIAGIGPDWPSVVRWLISLARIVIERRAGVQQPPDDNPPTGGTSL